MAWSWSHTAEAYDNAYRNLERLPVETIRAIWAEWRAYDVPEDDFAGPSLSHFNPELYPAALAEAATIPAADLVDDIWDQASELATCTNGGWEAWLCPFGCGCHMVPFDDPDDPDEDDDDQDDDQGGDDYPGPAQVVNP